MRDVGYNNQRDNFTINGIGPWSQCFATCAWMLLSFYAPETYRFDDDKALKKYIAEITAGGVAREYEWEAQRIMIQKYLDRAGVEKRAKLGINLQTGIGTTSTLELHNLLKAGPVIIGTKKMAGLPGGHIILGIDNVGDDEKIAVNDPFGNAVTGYTSVFGKGVEYPISWFDAKFMNGPVRTMYCV